MFKTIEGAADCEIRSVIRFSNAKNVLLSEIHHQICQVYGDNAMSDGMVRKWVRMFNEGRENAHDGALWLHDKLGHTLLLRLKTASPNLSVNKWTTPGTALIWRQVIFTSSCTYRISWAASDLTTTMT